MKKKEEKPKERMGLQELPAMIIAEQVSAIVGCAKHYVPDLVGAGLLTPVGKPSKRAVKYFARDEVIKSAQELKWLERVAKVIYNKW